MKNNLQNIIQDGLTNQRDDVFAPPATKITPEIVRTVAEKVYGLWLRDLQLEHERLGVHSNLVQRQRGK